MNNFSLFMYLRSTSWLFHRSLTARCPLHDSIRGDRNGINEHNIPEGCICYEPGPANQRCPLHEIEAADEIIIADPLNDSLNELLEAVNFHTPQENDLPEPADDIEILPPIPHYIGAANYLLATNRQNIEVHNCGQLDQTCPHCNAKFFLLERNSRGTYNKCCSGGNVFLAPFTQHPQELQRLFTGQHQLSREFKRNINVYNNCFQFASVQANLREIPGQGPFVYAVQGQIYHHYSDININREQQNFGPVYYLDPEEAIQQRVNNAGENNVNPALIRLIEDELRNVNPYARVYNHLHRVYEEQQQQQDRALNNENNPEIPRFILRVNGRRLSEFGIDDPPEQINIIEDNIDVDAERREADILVNQLNDEQHNIFDMITRAVQNDNEPRRLEQHNIFDMITRAVQNDNEPRRLFYISGSGGVGKSFLYNCIITQLNALEIKVISVASTGIAAALLKQGRTVHSRFQLPVPVVENSTSRITRESDDARFIRDAKFLIWDEVSMSNRLTFELVDKTIRFLCNDNDRPFGGKVVIIGGDFKQCLPIVQDGNRATVIQACIKSSRLWNLFQHYRLQTNMRVRPEEQDFMRNIRRLPNSIEIPPECVTETLEDLIQNIFGDLRPGQVLNRAILTPLNENCHLINERILNQIDNPEIVYHSINDVISDDPETRDMYPVEFLNSLTPSGFPQHTLKLKEGCIIMLLRNLNVRANLCNGTRLLIRRLGELYIDAEIIRFDGQLSNKRVFIPRVDFTTNQTSNLPFTMRRRQVYSTSRFYDESNFESAIHNEKTSIPEYLLTVGSKIHGGNPKTRKKNRNIVTQKNIGSSIKKKANRSNWK
ncbi:PIF1-like helicase [Popillia japonica]|uniref:ATP-dependent DNA helicase n=1 Tax=Popillia japonica TaxID=7064 RepID=A0AAW1HSL6_POPJA